MVLLLVCQGLFSFFIIRLLALLCYLYLRIYLPSPHFQYTPSNILNSMKNGRKSGRKEEEGREGDKKKERK